MKSILRDKSLRLFLFLGGFFITNALVAEFIGTKIFSVEDTLGIKRFAINMFDQSFSVNMSAGVILWPIVFIMTDIINEYFGTKGVKLLSYFAVALISFSFIMIYLAIQLSPADFWQGIKTDDGISNAQAAFKFIFGQSNWIIVGSIVAFGLGQIIDATVFKKIRLMLGERMIWLRATLSTVVSQFFDSFVVLYIAFVIGPAQMDIPTFLALGTIAFLYKVIMAILMIPLLYVVRGIIDKYLGEKESNKLKKLAISH